MTHAVIMHNMVCIGKELSCGEFRAVIRDDGVLMTNGGIYGSGPTLTPVMARRFAEWVLENVPSDQPNDA